MTTIRSIDVPPTLECLFARLRTRAGLILLGAGASAGLSPLGRSFWLQSPLAYLRDLRSFSPVVSPRSLLTQRMIDLSGIDLRDVFPNRELRPGSDELPLREILRRLPDGFARLYLLHVLARERYRARTLSEVPDSYSVFRQFHPSVIADYNHDGLAREFAGPLHEIVEMHGTVHPSFGAAEFGTLIADLRDFDIATPPDDLIMGVPESWTDLRLERRLSRVLMTLPRHVVIIGYSFAQTMTKYDDYVSLSRFIRRFKNYYGNIYVISPDPTHICEMLSDRLEINTVIPIKRYWNILAHAFLDSLRSSERFRSLNYAHEKTLDAHGSDRAFFIPGGRSRPAD